MKIKRYIEVEVEPKEDEIIQQIWEMDAVDQFYFLAHLNDKIFENYAEGEMQLGFVSKLMLNDKVDKEIKDKVRHFIEKLNYILPEVI